MVDGRMVESAVNIMLAFFLLLLAVVAIIFCIFNLRKSKVKKSTIAFFHPYCASGGGGERVLWMTVFALLKETHSSTEVVIYTGDVTLSKEDILNAVKDRFQIIFTPHAVERISFVYIRSRTLLEAKWYPFATMLFQSLGSILVGLECNYRLLPAVLVDTTGAAFIYPLFRMLNINCKVVAYVHYPIISSDMLQVVREQRPTYNNAGRIASNITVSSLKLFYYHCFAAVYGWTGSFAHSVLVNSSWTMKHISSLWKLTASPPLSSGASRNHHSARRLVLIYPPCNTSQLSSIPLSRGTEQTPRRAVISIGQFRPEKDHLLQIRALRALRDLHPTRYEDVQLVVIGSTRHEDDRRLLAGLRTEAHRLQLNSSESEHSDSDGVLFVVNQSYDELERWMARGLVGVHSMWNEHFGISVVEMLAAGLVVVAHRSGGPQMDIINHGLNGYLAETADEYAECMSRALDQYVEHDAMKQQARESTQRFSDEKFMQLIVPEIQRFC